MSISGHLACRRRTVLAGLATSIAGAAGLTEDAGAQSAQAAVKYEVWRGQYGGGTEKRIDVLADAAAWQRAWQSVDKPPAAAFAAGKHQGLFASQGQKMTGGFRVEVVSAARDGNVVRVVLRDAAPASDRVVTQALSEPWAIVLLETGGLPVKARWAE